MAHPGVGLVMRPKSGPDTALTVSLPLPNPGRAVLVHILRTTGRTPSGESWTDKCTETQKIYREGMGAGVAW